MPGAFVDESAERISVPEEFGGGWIEIKSEMSVEDWERIEAEQFRLEVTPLNRRERRLQLQKVDDAPPQSGRFNPSYVTLLERNIVRWSWADRPLTRENIAKLKRPVADLIVSAIEERNIPLPRKG